MITHQHQLGHDATRTQRRLDEQGDHLGKVLRMVVALTDRALLIQEEEQFLGTSGTVKEEAQALLENRCIAVGSSGSDTEGSPTGACDALPPTSKIADIGIGMPSPVKEDFASVGSASPGLAGLARILQEDHASEWDALSARRAAQTSTSYGSDMYPTQSPELPP